MSISKELMDAINKNDVVMTKIILKNNILLDPSFALYDETSAYAQKRLNNLFDEHDGGTFEGDSEKWTKDYLDGLMVDLTSNFSKERISHIRKVCARIYGKTAKPQSTKTPPSYTTPHPGNRTDNKQQDARYHNQIGIGLTVGGTAVAAVGFAVSKPVIIGAGIAAAIAGGVIIAMDKS